MGWVRIIVLSLDMREDLFSANVGYENGKGSHDIILCVKKRNSSRASESFDKTFKCSFCMKDAQDQ